MNIALKGSIKAIGKHINNALKKELANSVVVNFATTASDGKEFNNELIKQRNVQKMHIPNSQQD